ncbi:MAG TPA: NADH-quinone oxidoreductase subunit J [Opitutaceae bacterium]|nr:NADH-quinone oxidoreductase subunit J [Opitutaceae bacterium]
MHHFLLTLFCVFTVGCAAGVVVCRNTVNAALCLLLSLVGVAALFLRLEAYLLAFLLLLVYAGAVVALFLFIIMLLDERGKQSSGPPRGLALGSRALAVLLVGAGVVSFAVKGRLAAPSAAAVPALGASLKLYAYELFTTYLLPVQLIGFLLLIAMLGVIALSRRPGAPHSGYGT